MQIARAGECLADDSRAYDLSIADDELTVGFVAEEHLCQPGDDERVNDTQQHGCYDRHQNCNLQILFS